MKLNEKIKRIRSIIKDKKVLLFVDFLEILFEWVSILFENKRLNIAKKQLIEKYIPIETINALQYTNPKFISENTYNIIKSKLLDETKKLIDIVIQEGDLKIHDFDLLQFNLYQIFGKDNIASMIEWIRVNLNRNVERKKLDKEKAIENKKKRYERHLKYINSLSDNEIVNIVTNKLFDFTPSARTKEERHNAIIATKKIMVDQKDKFHKFELKMAYAAEDFQKESQILVLKKINYVKDDVQKVSEKFKNKSKYIVSSEGPKKEILAARKRVSKGQDILKKGRKNFEEEVVDLISRMDKSRKSISNRREKFMIEERESRKNIKESSKKTFKKAEDFVKKAEEHMKEEREGSKIIFSSARKYLKKGKTILEREKEGLEFKKDKLEGTLNLAQDKLSSEKVGLDLRVIKEKDRLKFEGDRLALIKSDLLIKNEKEREQIEFVKEKLKKQAETSMINSSKEKERINLQSSKVQARKFITGIGNQKESYDDNFMNKRKMIGDDFSLKKINIEKLLNKKKAQLAYEVRFKHYNLKNRAIKQKESMVNIFEEFQERQKTLLARHRSKTKANMIKAFLHGIRSMNAKSR